MYTEDTMTISKTDDDKFIVSIKVQKKPVKDKNSPVMQENMMKQFIADTPEDIVDLMEKHLKKGVDDKDAYNKGYAEDNEDKVDKEDKSDKD